MSSVCTVSINTTRQRSRGKADVMMHVKGVIVIVLSTFRTKKVHQQY